MKRKNSLIVAIHVIKIYESSFEFSLLRMQLNYKIIFFSIILVRVDFLTNVS